MFRLISLAAILSLAVSFMASDHENVLRDKTLALVAAVSPKAFEKTWKGAKEDWFHAFGAADGPHEMAAQLKELIPYLKTSKAFAASWPSKKDRWLAAAEACADWDVYADLIMELGKQINRTALSDVFDPSSWQGDIEATKKAYINEVKAPQPQINETTFNNQFMEIFRTSISGLEQMGVGRPSTEDMDGDEVKIWTVEVVLSGAAKADVRWSKSHEVCTYRAFYHAGTSKDNAWKIVDRLVGLIDAQIPEGYVSKRKASVDYVDSKMHLYEFDTQEFRITMKRPEVSIGITEKEGVFKVLLLLREPYYKNQYQF